MLSTAAGLAMLRPHTSPVVTSLIPASRRDELLLLRRTSLLARKSTARAFSSVRSKVVEPEIQRFTSQARTVSCTKRRAKRVRTRALECTETFLQNILTSETETLLFTSALQTQECSANPLARAKRRKATSRRSTRQRGKAQQKTTSTFYAPTRGWTKKR